MVVSYITYNTYINYITYNKYNTYINYIKNDRNAQAESLQALYSINNHRSKMSQSDLKNIAERPDHRELSARGGQNKKGKRTFRKVMELYLSDLDVKEGGEGNWAAPVVRRLIKSGIVEGDIRALTEILNRLLGRSPLIENKITAGVISITKMPTVQVGGQDLEYKLGSTKEEATEETWRRDIEAEGYKIVDVDGEEDSDEETNDTEEEIENVQETLSERP
jgi:hypothetical protein